MNDNDDQPKIAVPHRGRVRRVVDDPLPDRDEKTRGKTAIEQIRKTLRKERA